VALFSAPKFSAQVFVFIIFLCQAQDGRNRTRLGYLDRNIWQVKVRPRSSGSGAAGNPYDGRALTRVIPAIEQLVGNTIERDSR
jgi:hypothetical protein